MIIRPCLNQKITSLRRRPFHSHHHIISTQTSSPLGWNDGSNQMNNPKSNELERLPTKLSTDISIFVFLYLVLQYFFFCHSCICPNQDKPVCVVLPGCGCMSQRLHVATSACRNVCMSQRLHVATSACRNVCMSQRSHVATSARLDVLFCISLLH